MSFGEKTSEKVARNELVLLLVIVSSYFLSPDTIFVDEISQSLLSFVIAPEIVSFFWSTDCNCSCFEISFDSFVNG